MYMNIRWNHDHEYFQRMIEWEQRVAVETGPSSRIITRSSNEDELVGALITNMQDFLDDESSSDNSSMPGLQSRGLSNSSSSNGSMPTLQDRAAEDSSSSDGIMSCAEDGVYDDGEHCGYKARSLKQIIGTNARGIEEKGERFSSISMALFKYSIIGQAQFPPNPAQIRSRIFVVPGNKCVFPRAQQQQRYNNGEAKVITSPYC